MNWIIKLKKFGENIKKNVLKKFPTKEEIEKSEWTSCCKGPILKKDLEDNFWVCKACGKHHRISYTKFNILLVKIITTFGYTNAEGPLIGKIQNHMLKG